MYIQYKAIIKYYDHWMSGTNARSIKGALTTKVHYIYNRDVGTMVAKFLIVYTVIYDRN